MHAGQTRLNPIMPDKEYKLDMVNRRHIEKAREEAFTGLTIDEIIARDQMAQFNEQKRIVPEKHVCFRPQRRSPCCSRYLWLFFCLCMRAATLATILPFVRNDRELMLTRRK